MKRSVVTVGTFDGVHRGHRTLIERAAKIAGENNLRCIVVTLARPVRPVRGLITTLEEKIELLKSLPVDEIAVLPYHAHILQQQAHVFLERFICGELNAAHLVVGENFAFGRGREGTVPWLIKHSPSYGLNIDVVPPLYSAGRIISSSWIRDALHRGSVETASNLLGAYFSISGVQVPGRRIGSKLGFPTINVRVAEDKLLPHGVYAALIPHGDRLREAIVNIGIRPTFFKKGKVSVEAYLLGFSGKWNQAGVKIFLCRKLRKEKRFSSRGELTSQLHKDREKAQLYFAKGQLSQI